MRAHIERIEANLREILHRAERSARSPHVVAEELAREHLERMRRGDQAQPMAAF